MELSILCGSQVALVIMDKNGDNFCFSSKGNETSIFTNLKKSPVRYYNNDDYDYLFPRDNIATTSTMSTAVTQPQVFEHMPQINPEQAFQYPQNYFYTPYVTPDGQHVMVPHSYAYPVQSTNNQYFVNDPNFMNGTVSNMNVNNMNVANMNGNPNAANTNGDPNADNMNGNSNEANITGNTNSTIMNGNSNATNMTGIVNNTMNMTGNANNTQNVSQFPNFMQLDQSSPSLPANTTGVSTSPSPATNTTPTNTDDLTITIPPKRMGTMTNAQDLPASNTNELTITIPPRTSVKRKAPPTETEPPKKKNKSESTDSETESGLKITIPENNQDKSPVLWMPVTPSGGLTTTLFMPITPNGFRSPGMDISNFWSTGLTPRFSSGGFSPFTFGGGVPSFIVEQFSESEKT
eukprot:TRINITY_DN4101_c0_g1_i1.p1 TRINITY_DN4101_c0_g1~~TRINITY_DN4101_c0_g1_i1.p1  ORF type:complete len:437 (-),score=94.35 TRINITY_DN4101_c0_g1_i1:49-1266(-)